MATEVERLVARVEADLSGLKAGLTKAAGLTDKAANDMGASLRGMAGPAGVAERAIAGLGAAVKATLAFESLKVGVEQLSRFQEGSLKLASGIKDMALQAGFGTKGLQELQFAALQTGISEDQLGSALQRMSVEIGKARDEGISAVPALERLGVHLTDASGAARGNEAVFRELIERLHAIKDPAIRAADSVAIFGREAGPKFAELIEQGSAGLDEYARAASEAGAILQDDFIEAMKKTEDELAILDKRISVNLAKAFGTTTPLVKVWKEGVEFATGALAAHAEAVERSDNFVTLFGGDAQRAATRATTHWSDMLQVSEDYLGVLDRITHMSEGMPAPFANAPTPFQGQIPLRDGPSASPAAPAGVDEAAKKEFAARIDYAKEYQVKLRNMMADSVNADLNFNEIRNKEFADANERAEKILADSLARQKEMRLDSLTETIFGERRLSQAFVDFEEGTNETRLQSSVKLADGLIQSYGRTNKRAFELSKKAAEAQAIVSAFQLAVGAAADTKAPWYVRLGVGVTALAYGMAQVRAIQAQSFEGGGGGGARGTGGAAAISDMSGAAGQGGLSSRTINISGINPNDLFTGRQLLDLINQATADGGVLKAI